MPEERENTIENHPHPEMEFQMRSNDLDYISIVNKDKLERIYTYNSWCPGFFLIRQMEIFRIKLVMAVSAVIEHKGFEAVSLVVIVGNSVQLALQDPTKTT